MRYYPSHLEEFHGLPVHTFGAEGDHTRALPEPGSVAWRLSAEWDLDFEPLWGRFLEAVDTEEVTALVVGMWWERRTERGIDFALDLLTAHARRLPNLRALFLADVESEQTEISWIKQGEVTRALRAWPLLEELGVRGGEDLVIEPLRHDRLRTLRIESGGLPQAPVRALAACEFPALRHLELWLGTPDFGGECTPEDIPPLLTALSAHSPELRHLGLKNSDIQDAVAAAVAAAPVVAGLESLDLSLGTLGDEGGAALLSGQPLTHLRALNLRHHYLSDALVQRLRETLEPHGVDLVLTPVQRRGHYTGARYVAVGE